MRPEIKPTEPSLLDQMRERHWTLPFPQVSIHFDQFNTRFQIFTNYYDLFFKDATKRSIWTTSNALDIIGIYRVAVVSNEVVH
ncbi:hypothetical protein OA90_27615 [Labrenzia sp. OB1]|nr:hypothetical protein OA90_27615 [Labrenzia sp. OB1]